MLFNDYQVQILPNSTSLMHENMDFFRLFGSSLYQYFCFYAFENFIKKMF